MYLYHSIPRVIILLGLAAALALANPATAQRGGKNAPFVGKTFAGGPCKGHHSTVGTYDYLRRAQNQGALDLVEEHHFTAGVENLTKGTTTEPMGDIDFVLRSWPNHHRALYSAMTFRLRHKKWPPYSKGLPAECYYQRAIAFSPRDLIVHKQFAVLQHKFKKYKGAVETYKAALKLEPGNELMEYNMGLALVELKKYKPAMEIAEQLYALGGFPLPGLKNKLVAAGRWKPKKKKTEPEVVEANATAEKGSAKGTLKKDERYARDIAKFLAAKKTTESAGDTAVDGGSAPSQKDQRYAQEIAKFLAAKKTTEGAGNAATQEETAAAATEEGSATEDIPEDTASKGVKAGASSEGESDAKPDEKLSAVEQRYAKDIAKFLAAKKAAEGSTAAAQ